jgi:hypothetical protein
MGMLVIFCGAVRRERANKRHPVSGFLNQNGLTGLSASPPTATTRMVCCPSGRPHTSVAPGAFAPPRHTKGGERLGNRPHIRPDS